MKKKAFKDMGANPSATQQFIETKKASNSISASGWYKILEITSSHYYHGIVAISAEYRAVEPQQLIASLAGSTSGLSVNILSKSPSAIYSKFRAFSFGGVRQIDIYINTSLRITSIETMIGFNTGLHLTEWTPSILPEGVTVTEFTI